jgi:integrase/recombinase XerD
MIKKPTVVRYGTSFCLDGIPSKFISQCNEFLTTQEVLGRAPLTIRAYAFDLLFLFRWIQKNKIIFKDLDERQVVQFIQSQRDIKQAPASINRRLSTLELFYRFCFDISAPGTPNGQQKYRRFMGYDRTLGIFQIRKNIHRGLRVKEPEKIINGLSAKEVNSFLRVVDNYRDMAMVLLMLLCGLRSREVIGLETKNISFSGESIRVLGKGRKERELPMPEQISKIIIKYIDFERPAFSESPNLFVVLKGKTRGEPMTPSGVRSLFRYKRRLSGVASANPHRFRHTFGRDMATHGVQLATLQKIMGHADHSTTLKYIRLHLADVKQEYNRAMQRIESQYAKS